jgi:hypothetical protein
MVHVTDLAMIVSEAAIVLVTTVLVTIVLVTTVLVTIVLATTVLVTTALAMIDLVVVVLGARARMAASKLCEAKSEATLVGFFFSCCRRAARADRANRRES